MTIRSVKGYTLIELVAVIVIMGILGVASTRFIVFGTEIYVESNERQRVLSQSRYFIERLTRELRASIPNSVRVDATNACLQFVPIKASGAYKTVGTDNPAPISPNISFGEIEVVSWDVNQYAAEDRIYIYATSPDEIYINTNTVGGNFAVIESITPNPLQPNYKLELFQIAGSEDVFSDASPISRYFTADRSVNYCFIANSNKYDVYRFETTNFSPAQSVPTSPSGVLMAEGLTNNISSQAPFSISDAAQVRNSIVNLYLQFETLNGEDMFYNHEVHIPNVP